MAEELTEMTENGGEIVVRADLPGIEADEVKVEEVETSVEDGVLVVRIPKEN